MLLSTLGTFGALIAGYSIGQLAIYIVAIAAIVGLVYIALNNFGVAIPEWVKQVFWIIVVAFVIIAGIRVVMSM